MKEKYKKLVDETKKELKEEAEEKFKETVKKTAKDLLLKIKKEEGEIDKHSERLNTFKKQLVDLETGNVEYNPDGTVAAIVIEDAKTGKKIRITPEGEIKDGQVIGSSDVSGMYIQMHSD